MDGRRTDNTMAKRKGQEKFEDVKDVIRSHRWKKDRQHNGQNKKGQEKFEDVKEVIRSHRWKDRQHNGQNKNDKKSLKMPKR